MPDKQYLQLKYKLVMKKKLNLQNPQTYNEKIQWLKLYDRNPKYTDMVDKYEAKKYVANLIGEEYIIPTIGIYDTYKDINFDELPNEFVIKPTHTSGDVFICKDKSTLDYKLLQKKVEKWLKRRYFYLHREWPYKNIKPRLIIEKFMEDKKKKELIDYKFFCFNGEPKIMFIATDRQNKNTETCFDFYDMEFKHLNIINGHPNSKATINRPLNFELMKELAQKLSRRISHVRVDFYEVDGKVYFGELTFTHWSGLVPFQPEEWDKKIGDMIDLPK